MKEKRKVSAILYHVVICLVGIVMIYPLLWMIMSSFKETGTIFTTASSLIPEKFTLENYKNGWSGFAGISFGVFFKNSLFISIVATIGTIISSAFVAYGFARFKFRGRKLLFAAMLLSMMLPAQVLMIPQYLWYQKLGWVGTYLPMIVPYFFATQGFFVYLMSNFIEGIPRELDDFLSALLYINKTAQYPVSLALKLFCDPGSSSDYGAMFAMATLSVLPAVLIFLFFQKYLVDGISTSGLKG